MEMNGCLPGSAPNTASTAHWLLGFAFAIFIVDNGVLSHEECSCGDKVSLEPALPRPLK